MNHTTRREIEDFCRRWRIAEFSLLGSVVREDFGPESDVDVLVVFEAGATRSLLDRVRMVNELEEIFDRRVDLVQERLLENPLRRRDILRTKELVHAA